MTSEEQGQVEGGRAWSSSDCYAWRRDSQEVVREVTEMLSSKIETREREARACILPTSII